MSLNKSKFIKKYIEKAFITDDVPSDNNAYLRNNNNWKFIETPISSISDVPNDNKIYDRKDNAWTIQDAKTRLFSGNVIGIELVSPGGGSGTWRNIDKDGVPVTFLNETQRKSYFDNHPVWGGIKEEIIDGQHMIRIPKFYFKNDNHQKIWISPYKVDNTYKCHPAFMKNGEEMDCFWIGKYQGSVENNMLCSVPNVPAAVNLMDVSSFASSSYIINQSYINNRNINGITGFKSLNIYMWAVIQFLFLIEFETTDCYSKFGLGIIASSGKQDVSNDINLSIQYRGITGLYGNVGIALEGFKNNKGKIQIWDNLGNETFVDTSIRNYLGYSNGSKGWVLGYNMGYTQTCHIESGDNYDCNDVFLPDFATLKAKLSDGTYNGVKGASTSLITCTVLGWGQESNYPEGKQSVGIWNMNMDSSSSVVIYTGSRLSKI